MKLKFLLGTAVASMLALTSCKKDDPATPAPGTPGTENPGSSKQLKKVTRREAGTSVVFNLSYDGSKRLVSYKNNDNSEFVNFSYDAQGNLTGIEQQEAEFKSSHACL